MNIFPRILVTGTLVLFVLLGANTLSAQTYCILPCMVDAIAQSHGP